MGFFARDSANGKGNHDEGKNDGRRMLFVTRREELAAGATSNIDGRASLLLMALLLALALLSARLYMVWWRVDGGGATAEGSVFVFVLFFFWDWQVVRQVD